MIPQFHHLIQKEPNSMLPLALMSPGERGTICRIQENAPAIRQRLLEMGFISGTPIEVIRFAPLGDPMEIAVNGYRISLRRNEAQTVMIRRDPR
jgi:ferrous iron transport protein A